MAYESFSLLRSTRTWSLTSHLSSGLHTECFTVRVLISSIMGEVLVCSTGVCLCSIHEGKVGKWFSGPAQGSVKESERGKKKRHACSYHYHCLAWFPPRSDLLVRTETKPHRWWRWRGMWQSRIFSSFRSWSSVVFPTAIINKSHETAFPTRKFCPPFISHTSTGNGGKILKVCMPEDTIILK